MMSYTQLNFDQIYIKARDLNQFVSEIIDYWQQDSARCAIQYEIINFVTMATYWVPDLPNVRGFSGFFWHPFTYFSMMPYLYQVSTVFAAN